MHEGTQREAGLWGPPRQMPAPGLCLALSLCARRQSLVPAPLAVPALHGKWSFSSCRPGVSCDGRPNRCVLLGFLIFLSYKKANKTKQSKATLPSSVTGAPFKGSAEVLPVAASAGRGFPKYKTEKHF